MREVQYLDAMREVTERMTHGGVFLSTGGERPNVMTVGWGWMGFCWGRPVFTAVVRPQRHTYAILCETGEFTISVPAPGKMRAELAFAGTRSGREIDKFDGHGLTAAPARKVKAPIVAECGLHLECRTLLVQDMTADRMAQEVIDSSYPGRDFHAMFFGEIVDCYRTDD